MKMKRFAVGALLCVTGMFAEAQNVGVGQLNPISKIDISGNATIGSGYSGTSAAPANGMNIQGAVVIGSSAQINTIDKFGCATTGTDYGINSYHTNSSGTGSAIYGLVSGSNGVGLRIDHAATTGYGATFSLSSSAATAGLFGDANVNGPNGIMGEYTGSGSGSAVYASGRGLTTGSWQTTSDARLKDNILPLTAGLETVVQLKPVSYSYKKDLATKYNFETQPQMGFLAQDLEQILPDMVYEAKLISVSEQTRGNSTQVETMEVKTVNYSALIPVLTKAIQEQQIQIESLQQSVLSMEAEIVLLKTPKP